MPSLTAIELGSDTCAFARTSVHGSEMRVMAVEILDPASFPGIDSFTKAVKQVRRTLKLPRRARAVVWGLPDGASRRDPAVRPLIEPLTGAGFRVERVVSPCNALAALARLRTPRPEAATCWLAVNRGGVAIVAVRPGKQLYSHSFIWDSSIGSTGSQARMLQRYSLVSYLAPEVKRAMNAARQKGTPVEAIVTCGNLPDLRSLTMPLIEELDVEVETLDSLEGLVVKPDLADRLSETAASIRIACAGGIARASRARNEAFAGGLKRGRLITAAAAAVALFAAGWFLYAGMLAPRPARVVQSARVTPPPRQQPSPAPTRGSLPPPKPTAAPSPKPTAAPPLTAAAVRPPKATAAPPSTATAAAPPKATAAPPLTATAAPPPKATAAPPPKVTPAAPARTTSTAPPQAPAPKAPVTSPPSTTPKTSAAAKREPAPLPAVAKPTPQTKPVSPPPAQRAAPLRIEPPPQAKPPAPRTTSLPPAAQTARPPSESNAPRSSPSRGTIPTVQEPRIPAAPPKTSETVAKVEPLPKPQTAPKTENPPKPEAPKIETAHPSLGAPPLVAPPSTPLNAGPRPADRPEAGKAGQNKPLPPLLKDPLPRVTAILVANDRRFATIDDGHIITIGDVIGRRVVVAIDERAVVLREPSGVQIRVALGGRLEGIDRGGR